MTYSIKIDEKTKATKKDSKSEIWAEIIDSDTNKKMDKLIWWKDKKGVIHDCTPDLPPELREKVDNAWLEKKRKW
ncbi:MAG: hypothetical protein V5A64_02465 [Candidatus Thermoplasmatota archaeon]